MLINYREQDFVEEIKAATDGAGADVILDNMGAKYLDRNVKALAVNGRLAIIGMQGGIKARAEHRGAPRQARRRHRDLAAGPPAGRRRRSSRPYGSTSGR